MVAVSTTAVIAVLAFAAAAALATIALTRRLSPSTDSSDHLAKAVDEMRLKMDELSQDLSQALERAERESRRNRLFGELGGSIDLQELMDRVLDAAMEVGGFDAALIVVEGHGAAPVVATRALSPEEAEKPPTSGVVGALSGTITVTYRYGRDRESPEPNRICGGLFIPLIGRDLAPIGTLSLFWRDPDFEPTREHIERAESLAESSIPAIENARRYGEARKLAETDALTGLYNQRFFHETLRREVLRAQRYERDLALIVFDVDDFKGINDEIGHLAGDRVLSQAADRMRDAVRSVDIPCRIGGDEFAVILPESSAQDADQLYRRVQSSMRGTALGPDDDRLRLSAGIAELQHGDTAAGLFERADAALYRAKDQGKDRADIARIVDRSD
jgi:diguanylate cyclase (GGDEF)-like protein